MVCGELQKNFKRRNKRGFGIVEVMIAAAVLGFLYMAVLNLQGGNHEALLRIRGRDGATEVAQNLIDSLGALGLASLSDKMIGKDEAGNLRPIIIDSIPRSWSGQPGILTNTVTVYYDAIVTVSPDSAFMAKTMSKYLEKDGEDTIRHVYAKRLDVTVNWRFKGTPQSITVTGVVK